MLVDSSVWIDYFNGIANPATDALDSALGKERIIVGDVVLAEVLSGFRSERDHRIARDMLLEFEQAALLGTEMALATAANYRSLRRRGVTVRKMLDAVIATYCIQEGLSLLHRDRDFEPFCRHAGLRSVIPLA